LGKKGGLPRGAHFSFPTFLTRGPKTPKFGPMGGLGAERKGFGKGGLLRQQKVSLRAWVSTP